MQLGIFATTITALIAATATAGTVKAATSIASISNLLDPVSIGLLLGIFALLLVFKRFTRRNNRVNS